jgi:hypothetical protein
LASPIEKSQNTIINLSNQLLLKQCIIAQNNLSKRKEMKKTIQFSFIIIALLISSMAFGQRRMHRGGGDVFKLIEESKAEMKLTPDQEQQLETLKVQFEEDRKALREQDFDKREDRKAAMGEMMESHRTAIQEVLTEEQAMILQAKMEARKQNRKDARKNIDKEGLKKDLKAYHTENIEPVLKEQRAKLEQEISQQDQITIGELRMAFATHREEMKALKKEGKGKRGEQREKFKALREEMKDEHETLKGLVATYEEEIDALFAEIESETEQWKTDLQAIHEQYMPEGGKARKGKEGKAKGRKKGKKGHRMGDMPQKGKFLLMDPNGPVEGMATEEMAAQDPVDNFQVYPNPAQSDATATFDLSSASTFQVELRSEQGTVLQVLEPQRSREAGAYQVSIDLSDLKDGVYYVVLSGEMGVKAQKLVVARG